MRKRKLNIEKINKYCIDLLVRVHPSLNGVSYSYDRLQDKVRDVYREKEVQREAGMVLVV